MLLHTLIADEQVCVNKQHVLLVARIAEAAYAIHVRGRTTLRSQSGQEDLYT